MTPAPRDQLGVVLMETVLLGFAVVLLVLPILVAIGRVSAAHATTTAVATDVAHWVARHGHVPATGDEFRVHIDEDRSRVTVRVAVDVPLLPGSVGVATVEVSAMSTAVVSPYRSAVDD